MTTDGIELSTAWLTPVVIVELELHRQPDQSHDHIVDEEPLGERSGPPASQIVTWRQAERVLAGFPDRLADEGPTAGPASLVGLRSPGVGLDGA